MKLGNIESLRPYHINGRSVNNRFWSNEKASFSTSESIGVAMMMHEEVWEGTTGRKLWLMDGCGPHVGELMEWCAQRGIDIILRTPNLTDLLQNEDLHNFHVMRNNKDSGFMKLKHERLMENFRNGITGLTLGDNIECMDRAIRNAFTEQNNMTAHRMAGTRPFRAGPLRDLINRRNEEAQAAKAASARLEKTVAPSADGNTVRLLSSIIGMLGGGGAGRVTTRRRRIGRTRTRTMTHSPRAPASCRSSPRGGGWPTARSICNWPQCSASSPTSRTPRGST